MYLLRLPSGNAVAIEEGETPEPKEIKAFSKRHNCHTKHPGCHHIRFFGEKPGFYDSDEIRNKLEVLQAT